MKTQLLPCVVCVFVLAACTTRSGVDSTGRIREGECWSYASRPGEEGSFLVVRKIEFLPEWGEVFHIAIYGVRVRAPFGDLVDSSFGAFSAPVLRASLRSKIEKQQPDPRWESEYRRWRQGYERGGRFAVQIVPIADSLNAAQEQFDRSVKRANKAPEPTPGAVTPRATEGTSR